MSLKKSMSRLSLAAALLLQPLWASADAVNDAVQSIQSRWAQINYDLDEGGRAKAFAELAEAAHALVEQSPGRAEPLIWEGIVLSTQAGSMRGFSMLKAGGVAKSARDRLLEAEKIDPTALQGSIYTSLGSLYAEAPGWPISFGDKDKARAYLQRALELNPNGIDSNYFWGKFLQGQQDFSAARSAYEKALAAPDRPNRPRADAGRRAEISAALASMPNS
jgi:tetratricopeptide (TPR) repeat protein